MWATLRNIEHVSASKNWQIFWCASRLASACRSGGRHLGKFAWGSNLALVFEAVQSRPPTTFPESWHDYWKQYFRSFGRGICLPDSPNWRYRQNYDVNKWQVWIREALIGWIIQYRHHLRPRMDGIVGKTYQTQCCRKCKILARLTDYLWLMVGWSVSVLGSPSINNLLRPCNQSKMVKMDQTGSTFWWGTMDIWYQCICGIVSPLSFQNIFCKT